MGCVINMSDYPTREEMMAEYEREQAELAAFEAAHVHEVVEIENDIEFLPGHPPFDDDDPYDYGYPDMSLGDSRSEITGNLKEMVLKRVGIDTSFGALDHKVEIIESHQNGGYCGTCAFEYTVFFILVDGEEVYAESYSSNPFGVLQDWLTEEVTSD